MMCKTDEATEGPTHFPGISFSFRPRQSCRHRPDSEEVVGSSVVSS